MHFGTGKGQAGCRRNPPCAVQDLPKLWVPYKEGRLDSTDNQELSSVVTASICHK